MSAVKTNNRVHPSLKAMAEEKVPGVNKVTNFFVDPTILQMRPGYNCRIMRPKLREHIDALKAVMRRGGRIPPIDVTVEDGTIYVEDGHCRTHAAVELARLEGLEIKLEARQFNGTLFQRRAYMDRSANALRLMPLEQGDLYTAMQQETGALIEDIAAEVGRSEQHVQTMIRIATCGPELRQLMIDEKIKAHTVLDTLRRFDGDMAKAGRFLVAKYGEAQKAGKSRITNKTINGISIPKRVVGSVVSSLHRISATISTETRNRLIADLSNYAGQDSAGATVAMPASCVADLLQMLTELDAHNARVAERDAKRQRKAARDAADGVSAGAGQVNESRQQSLLPEDDLDTEADLAVVA